QPSCRVQPRLEPLEERTLLTVQSVANINGIGYTGVYPPDTIGAAGYNTVGEAVNLTVQFWDKFSHASIYNRSLSSFFNALNLPGGNVLSLSDPVMTYDINNGQYVLGVLDYSSNQSRFDLAVSFDDDPRDGWFGYRYDMNDGVGGFDFADYPKLGYN